MASADRERQQAALAWAIADLQGLRARGVIDERAYTALRQDYEQRLQQLTAPVVAPEPPIPAEPVISPPAQAPPAAAPLAPPLPVPPNALFSASVAPIAPTSVEGSARSTNVVINLILFLGAFFVVMASLIFVISSWQILGVGAKAAIMALFTAAFIGGGLICLRLPRVRPAGQTFLGIGALLLPLDIVGAYTFFLQDQGISLATTWMIGAAICAIFYGALALLRIGRIYAVAALVATVAAWLGLIGVLNPPEPWIAPIFLVLPLLLLLAGWFGEQTTRGSQTFGAFPMWLANLLVPLGWQGTLPFNDFQHERVAPIVALILAMVFYALAAVRQSTAPIIRALYVAAGTMAGSLTLVSLGWWAKIQAREYAGIVLLTILLATVVGLLLRRVGPNWHAAGQAAILVGWLHLGLLLLPWGYIVPDGDAVYWTVIFGTALLYCLFAVWYFWQSWFIYPLAAAGSVTLFHLLHIGTPPDLYGYAWAYTLATLVPLAVLQPLRRRGVSQLWDAHLIVVSQWLALGTTAIAVAADNHFQTAAILFIFVLIGAAITAIERRPLLAILPNLWGVGFIAATVALAGAGQRWAPSFYAGTGLILALALQSWRGVAPARRTAWFTAHRWSAGLWAASGPLLGLWYLAQPLSDFLASGELRALVLASAYGPVGLAVTLCAAALAADATMTLRRPTGYSASAVIMLALLMAIARITPNNPQAYAIPLGLYLFALSVYVAYERDLGAIRMPVANGLLAAAIIVMLGTTFLQSLVHPWRYILLGLLEGLLFFFLTVFLRRRYGVAISVLFLTLTVLRAVFDVARSLPNWAIIGFLGLTLLTVAVLFLLRRDQLDRWFDTLSTRWKRLA